MSPVQCMLLYLHKDCQPQGRQHPQRTNGRAQMATGDVPISSFVLSVLAGITHKDKLPLENYLFLLKSISHGKGTTDV